MSQQKRQSDRIREAIAGRGKAKPVPEKVAAAATVTPPVPKKVNPRSAAARDERAKKRGRLPQDTRVYAEVRDSVWNGRMFVLGEGNAVIKSFSSSGTGQFETLEKLDVMFWDWFTSGADELSKASLVWHAEDVKPDPYPKEGA